MEANSGQSDGVIQSESIDRTDLNLADWPKKPTLCFVHIPKTGGSAIRDVLRLIRGRAGVFWMDSQESFEAQRSMTHGDFKQFDAVGGHVSVRALRQLVVAPRIVASLVRDPVRRAVSYLHYIQMGDTNHPLHGDLEGLSVVEALDRSNAFRADVTNAQWWMLGGDEFSPDVIPDSEDERWLLYPSSRSDILFEKLCSLFGWQSERLPRLNQAVDPGYFEYMETPEAVRSLRELNEKDLALVDAVDRRLGLIPVLR